MSNTSGVEVIARPDSYEIKATGKQVKGLKNGVAAAATWAAQNGKRVVGVEGDNAGVNFCAAKTKADTIQNAGAPIELVGMDPMARIRGVTLWQTIGVPGFVTLREITIAAQCFIDSKGKPAASNFAVLLCQKVATPFPGIEVVDSTLLSTSDDGASGANAMTDLRSHGQALVVRMKRVKSRGPWKEHSGGYFQNVLQELIVEDCDCEGAGRTGPQVTIREWEAFKSGVGTDSTLAQRQKPDAYCSIKRNRITDCSGYRDPATKQGSVANGSGITIAGWLGHVDVIGNTVVSTFPAGGALVAYYDGKQGSWRTPQGRAIATMTVDRNSFHGLAGAQASRDLCMVGAVDSLEWGANSLTGTLTGLVLDHGMKNGAVQFTAPKPTSTRYWQTPGAKLYAEVSGKKIALDDNYILSRIS